MRVKTVKCHLLLQLDHLIGMICFGISVSDGSHVCLYALCIVKVCELHHKALQMWRRMHHFCPKAHVK